jgi:hypothetical protein
MILSITKKCLCAVMFFISCENKDINLASALSEILSTKHVYDNKFLYIILLSVSVVETFLSHLMHVLSALCLVS